MFRSALLTLSAIFWLVGSFFAGALAEERRVALVVGNGLYRSVEPLANPRNDARDMASKLKSLGFDVILELDANKQTFQRDLAQFARKAKDSDVAMLFYAGHAMQYGGTNYFMPVDAQLEDEYSLASDMISFESVMTSLDAAKGIKLFVVDACRNNPLAERLASTSRGVAPTVGLAKVQASYGTLVAYSTQANKVAVDGTGRNSPFTTALLDQIGAPGVEVVSAFRRVIEEVYSKTDKRQLPEVSVQLVGEFYFNPDPSRRILDATPVSQDGAKSHAEEPSDNTPPASSGEKQKIAVAAPLSSLGGGIEPGVEDDVRVIQILRRTSQTGLLHRKGRAVGRSPIASSASKICCIRRVRLADR